MVTLISGEVLSEDLGQVQYSFVFALIELYAEYMVEPNCRFAYFEISADNTMDSEDGVEPPQLTVHQVRTDACPSIQQSVPRVA